MAIQFMFSPDGIDAVAAANTYLAAQRRGLLITATASRVETVSGGRKAFYSNTSYALLYRMTASNQLHYGVRLYAASAEATGGVFPRASVAGNAYLMLGLRSDGTLYCRDDNSTDIILGTGFLESVHVRVLLDGANWKFFINGSDTPIEITGTSRNWDNFVSHNSQRWNDFIIYDFADVVSGEDMVRLAPSVSAATTGTLVGGTASQAVELDTTAAYASLEPGQTLTSNVGGSITDSPQSIKAVQVTALGRKSGTALLPEKVLVTTPAGTEEIEPAIPLGLGFGASVLTMAVDPNDSAAWTKAKVNGLTVGGKG